MALNKALLKSDIKAIMTEMRTRTDVSDDEFADRLSTAIDTYVKTAAIVYVSGLANSGGPVTGTFAGNLE